MKDYTYLENALIPVRFVSVLAGIDTANEKLIEKAMECSLVAADMGRSAQVLTRKRAFSTGLKEKGFSGFSKTAESLLTQDGKQVLTVDFLLALHKSMRKGEPDSGKFRKSEWDEKHHMEYTIKPQQIKKELEEICVAYQMACERNEIPTLLLITVVLHDFLKVAAFESGNLYMAELLARFLLLDQGYEIVRYCPCNIEEENSYVEQLIIENEMNQGLTRDMLSLLEHILNQLKRDYEKVSVQLVMTKEKRVLKKDRIEKVVLESVAPISKAEICERLPDVSETTIEAQLAAMCKRGDIIRLGSLRDSVYVRKVREE